MPLFVNSQDLDFRDLNSVKDSIKQVAEILKNDGLAVIPTDTVYGITAIGSSPTAREKLLNLKPRSNTPIGFLIADIENENFKLEDLFELNQESKNIMAEHWPGALTLVLKRTQLGKDSPIFAGGQGSSFDISGEISGFDISGDLSFGGETAGIRCPDHPWLRELIRTTGPLATTSANLHKVSVAQDIESLAEEICQGVDVICDGGSLAAVASSVIDMTGEKPEVLREGTIKIDTSQIDTTRL